MPASSTPLQWNPAQVAVSWALSPESGNRPINRAYVRGRPGDTYTSTYLLVSYGYPMDTLRYPWGTASVPVPSALPFCSIVWLDLSARHLNNLSYLPILPLGLLMTRGEFLMSPTLPLLYRPMSMSLPIVPPSTATSSRYQQWIQTARPCSTFLDEAGRVYVMTYKGVRRIEDPAIALVLVHKDRFIRNKVLANRTVIRWLFSIAALEAVTIVVLAL